MRRFIGFYLIRQSSPQRFAQLIRVKSVDKFVANMPLNLCKIHSVYATGVPSDIQASAAGAATTTFCRRSALQTFGSNLLINWLHILMKSLTLPRVIHGPQPPSADVDEPSLRQLTKTADCLANAFFAKWM